VKKLFSLSVIAALILALLSACGGGGTKEGELEPLGKDDKAKIKVMFWDSQYFFNEYGNLFVSKFPNVEIEVADMHSVFGDQSSDQTKAIDKFIEEQKPDVLLLQPDAYEKYAAEGKLFSLESVIKQDEFKTEGMHPAILKLLRDKGNGSLYGLSPDFSSSAILYNIDLFKKHGVDLPKDSMTWEELFDLAKRFPTDGTPENRIYGFVPEIYMTISDLIYLIGAGQDLKVMNADASQVNVNTDSWKKVYQSTLDVAKSGSMYVPNEKDNPQTMMTMEDMYKRDLFITGRAAMSFGRPWEIQSIVQAKDVLKDVQPVNWGIVTAPVDPKNRNQSSYMNVSNIFSVNASSPNLRAAWEFVKYISSEEFAKIKAKSQTGNLLTWTAYNQDQDGRKLDAFYKLEPKSNSSSDFDHVSTNFYLGYRDIVDSEAKEVLADKKTVDEALKSIQDRAQAELLKAKQAAAAASPSPSASASPSASKP
jgi:multiple sugar transport system substrate-binding protein